MEGKKRDGGGGVGVVGAVLSIFYVLICLTVLVLRSNKSIVEQLCHGEIGVY